MLFSFQSKSFGYEPPGQYGLVFLSVPVHTSVLGSLKNQCIVVYKPGLEPEPVNSHFPQKFEQQRCLFSRWQLLVRRMYGLWQWRTRVGCGMEYVRLYHHWRCHCMGWSINLCRWICGYPRANLLWNGYTILLVQLLKRKDRTKDCRSLFVSFWSHANLMDVSNPCTAEWVVIPVK